MTPKQKASSGGILVAGLAALAFVSGWEGDEKVAYADKLAGGLPTVCNGHTGPDVRVGDVWSKERCDAILVTNLEKHGLGLLACVQVPINQNTYDALASWTFNVGVSAACGSTLVKLLNMGNLTGACGQLLRWNRASGVEVRGLTNRRKAERELCLKPVAPAVRATA